MIKGVTTTVRVHELTPTSTKSFRGKANTGDRKWEKRVKERGRGLHQKPKPSSVPRKNLRCAHKKGEK